MRAGRRARAEQPAHTEVGPKADLNVLSSQVHTGSRTDVCDTRERVTT
jgi:hypothetical protein